MKNLSLGPFSLSLSVQDIGRSLDFYHKLGFEVIDGGHTNPGFPDSDTTKWRILKSGKTKIGLFEGMFDTNILTFNPEDVRTIQQHLTDEGIPLSKRADPKGTGPDSIMLEDPDGNQILMDQQE